MHIIVVGAGLFGRVIGDHLTSLGHTVSWIDGSYSGSGSKPAACLMKPSWMSKIPRRVECLALLNRLYGVQDISFSVNGLANQIVHWVDPAKILNKPFYKGEVWEVDKTSVTTDRETFKADRVIVAAGVWTKRLLPQVIVEPRWGAAFLWPDEADTLQKPFISQWAPYRQVVAFNRGDGVWAGDGSTYKERQYLNVGKMLDRCKGKLGFEDKPIELIGQRPYCKIDDGDPCLVKDIGGVIAATGGAKNGTISAAWSAIKIGDMLG